MASSKRKKHGAGYVVLIAVLILVLLAAVAAATGYSLVARRVKALQAGAAFTFDYEITSTADSPAFTPSCKRQAPPRHRQRPVCAGRTAAEHLGPGCRYPGRPAHPGVYQQQRDLIRCRAAVQKYPLFHHRQLPAGEPSAAGLELGSYISQAQLASLLGVDTTATSCRT